jgi:hypothetical protein
MCSMLVKEAISYYRHNSSSVFCTLLDATKAFDRVNYNKLFRLLVNRDIPSTFTRLLLNMYTNHKTRIMWNGACSELFPVRNGVKQGGILSPILFCVYFDSLICRLVNISKGCYMGHICLAVLAYADDVVILAPTASAMRTLLALCDEFASEFDVKFNGKKSKCILFPPVGQHQESNIKPVFSIGGNVIDYVDSWPHLGHILHNRNGDSEDILHRRNVLIGQANDVICYFAKLSSVVKLNLLYTYCSSLYGSEIWDLNSPELAAIGVSWRKALKRLWNLPLGTHAQVLYA